MTKDEHTGRKLAIGTLIAGVFGYLAGLLTAPKSGKETRQDVANQLQKAHDELNEIIETTKDKGADLGAKAKEELGDALSKARDAQKKTATVLGAVKKGKAKDPELNAAIKQAKEAKGHLAKYLKN